jgi:DNA invertase Pin-like site-specific DNA recombinase
VSREFQTETVRRLADGPDLTILDGDWGKSAATDATDKRLAFLGLMEAIERGEVSTLYAYSTDRLARSVQWAARLLDACEKAGTTIVTSEGRFAPGDDMARTLFQFQAITNENYSRQAKRKAQATIATRRAKGTKLGAPFYGSLPGESPETVVAVYEQTGSLNGTATELNRLGLPARRGRWAHSSVQRILARAGVISATGTRGAKERAPHRFARLLRCHCGHTLTGSRRSGGATVYRCIRAETTPGHGRKSVAEAPVMAWAVAEMTRLRPPSDLVAVVEANTAARLDLDARLDRIRVAWVAGLYQSEAEMLAEKAEVDEAIRRLDLAGRAVRVPRFDWDHEPRDLNLALRALWEYVALGPDLRPLRAEWLVPPSWLRPAARGPGSPAAPVR